MADFARARVLAEAAAALYMAARSHKRSAERHRKQARHLMELYAKVSAECERAGVHIDLPTEPDEGGHSG